MTIKKRFAIKLSLLILAIATVLSVGVVGTLGLLTETTDTATNALALGKVDIELTEPAFPTDRKPDLNEDKTVHKNPQVTNNSPVPVWVRLTVAGGENNFLFTSGGSAAPTSEPEVSTYYTSGDYGFWIPDADNDGVWYWSMALDPDDTTEPLFDWVTLKSTYNGDGSDLDIVVYAEAVQADWIDVEGGYAGSASKAFEVIDPTPES